MLAHLWILLNKHSPRIQFLFIIRKGAAVLLCEKAGSKGKPTKGYTTKQKYDCVLLLENDKA
jgi:hypothetical protein